AGPHLHAPVRGRRDALRHARVRGRVADAGTRRGDDHQRGHRRRSDQRQLVRRHPRPVRAGPGDRGGNDDRGNRGSPGSGCGAVREGPDDQAGDRLRRGPHGAQGPPHGARRGDQLGVRGHRRREGGDQALGGTGRGAEPRRARGDGGPRPRPAAVPPGDGPPVSAARSGRPRVVVTRRLPAPVEEQLTREFDVRLNPDDRALSAAELADALRDADALLPTVTDRLTREVLAVEPLRARIIANYGVGFNHIDTASANARGLVVTNTPAVLTDDTADDAVMLMLMVARRGAEGDRLVRAGAWTGWGPTHLLGTRVSGKTLGLIGLRPHLGSATHETRIAMGLRALDNLKAFFAGAPPRDRVA